MCYGCMGRWGYDNGKMEGWERWGFEWDENRLGREEVRCLYIKIVWGGGDRYE